MKTNDVLTDNPQDEEESNESSAEDGYHTFKSEASVNIFKCEDNSNISGNKALARNTSPRMIASSIPQNRKIRIWWIMLTIGSANTSRMGTYLRLNGT
jgi:hypothetical protein